MEFQTIILNYNAKSSIEPEIFLIVQHKVERVPHFARVSEVRQLHSADDIELYVKCGCSNWALIYDNKDFKIFQSNMWNSVPFIKSCGFFLVENNIR